MIKKGLKVRILSGKDKKNYSKTKNIIKRKN